MSNHEIRLSRRDLMALALSAPVLAMLGCSPFAGEGERFLELSARLTGFPASALSDDDAAALLEALLAGERGAELERLLRDEPGAFEGSLAADIIAAWYSGVHPGSQGPRVHTYNGALVWSALDFTKPPGVCGGVPGHWSDPPRH